MYAYLEGNLSEINPAYAVIDCQGVGYMVHISLNTFTRIKDLKRAKLFTHLSVREDAHLLYGFADDEERRLFRNLITVSGVGANTARVILSSVGTREVVQAIISGNENVLKKIKGIGAKTAQRIIIDLRDKINKDGALPESFAFSYNRPREEALSGLVILGFNKAASEKALDKIIEKGDAEITVERLIKEALKIL
jgi:Holliday junction DNA helicase RuvA